MPKICANFFEKYEIYILLKHTLSMIRENPVTQNISDGQGEFADHGRCGRPICNHVRCSWL
jgi:hypothetical protein